MQLCTPQRRGAAPRPAGFTTPRTPATAGPKGAHAAPWDALPRRPSLPAAPPGRCRPGCGRRSPGPWRSGPRRAGSGAPAARANGPTGGPRRPGRAPASAGRRACPAGRKALPARRARSSPRPGRPPPATFAETVPREKVCEEVTCGAGGGRGENTCRRGDGRRAPPATRACSRVCTRRPTRVPPWRAAGSEGAAGTDRGPRRGNPHRPQSETKPAQAKNPNKLH